ncbi:DNA polymerase III subunit epsilon [Notoacmeibacter sp. MSK16QG-6]|uniref:DNA polymerase III subunit epsilon n=1 Tax=Notoacmeibacter sp. MSK16QG-6 TaxID=2957982 RepID=UPI00209FEF0C|nr:DNA polymerase III subunit epsilon [Notoacmeibacter sp. MSK16QG-6]MCP1199102.1 DNA polymerase III subunit epsilon [Notoacmeibacter sp. MSK16QG-6]
MREIIFDTETTGLDFALDRVIEIGGVEMVDRIPTGRTFHMLIHPEDRDVHADALAIHGIGMDKLAGKPFFRDVCDQFLEFFADAKLVAHNASFDVRMINAELARLQRDPLPPHMIVDTLELAKRRHPMGPNSLDALCRRYSIDSSRRTFHGALLDSELLLDVYLELTGGRQTSFSLDPRGGGGMNASADKLELPVRQRTLPARLSAEEKARHYKMVQDLGADSLWQKCDPIYRPTELLSHPYK